MPDRDAPGQLRMGYDAKELDELHELEAAVKRYHREKGSTEALKTVGQVFRILKSLGVRTYAELADETMVRRFIECTVGKKYADSTRDMLQGHLYSIIRLARDWRLLPCEPTLPRRVKPGGRQWRLEHPPSTRTRSPSPDAVLRVLDYFHARSNKWTPWRSYAFLATIAKTRLPILRALRVRKDDVDLDRFPTPMIRFRPRGGKERYEPIPADLVRILEKWIPENRSDQWVFPGPTKDAPWRLRSSHTATPASVLKAACRALGIEPPLTLQQMHGSLVSPRFEAISTTPPLDNTPPASAHQELDQAVPTDRLDEIAYADKLLERGFPLFAAFVRHFHGRTSTTWQNILEAVCPGEERDWATVRTWANRVNNALREIDPECPLRFHTRERSYLVVKERLEITLKLS